MTASVPHSAQQHAKVRDSSDTVQSPLPIFRAHRTLNVSIYLARITGAIRIHVKLPVFGCVSQRYQSDDSTLNNFAVSLCVWCRSHHPSASTCVCRGATSLLTLPLFVLLQNSLIPSLPASAQQLPKILKQIALSLYIRLFQPHYGRTVNESDR